MVSDRISYDANGGSGAPDSHTANIGDVAEIFGADLPIERHAELAGTVQYELLCAVSPRVPRIYRD